MSGGNIAYHLRPNKAADRALFLDLLSRVARSSFNISDYRYIGFGGPFMEDFRAIHSALRIGKMTCIERDPVVQARQEFNSPIGEIDYVLADSSTFLTGFAPADACVIWLDFTSPGELKQQLDDARVLVSKLAEGDVFRVTLNADVTALREATAGIKEPELVLLREAVFKDRAAGYVPSVVKPANFRPDQYPAWLLQALLAAVHKGVSTSPKLCVQPLSACVYSDGTTMLTATGIVLDKSAVPDFLAATRLAHWPFASLNWNHPTPIDLPVLSIRERLALESVMPNGSMADAVGKLGAAVGPNGIEPKSITSFKRFYRVYPEFVKVGA